MSVGGRPLLPADPRTQDQGPPGASASQGSNTARLPFLLSGTSPPLRPHAQMTHHPSR